MKNYVTQTFMLICVPWHDREIIQLRDL